VGSTGLAIGSILEDTAEIGAAGAGLTAVPWNAAWDAEVESEVTDALVAVNLDHLMKTGDATLTNIVEDNTALAHLMAIGADISDYDSSTDSLEGIAGAGGGGAPTVEQIRAEIDSNSTQLAAIVADTAELQTDWADGGRLDLLLDGVADAVWDELQNRVDDGEVAALEDYEAMVRTATGLASANLDTQLGDIPTTAEFEARTLVAADYATAATQTTIVGVTDKLDTGDDGGAYGPYALGLSAHSDTLSEFGGGNGQIGLHGTNDPATLGDAVSHGCVRLPNDVIAELAYELPLGTPVEIV
jgi:hypothetical protein